MEANLVALRAEALVVVHLTRRSDVDVDKLHDDAFDLLATIRKRSKNQDKRFGVQVRGVLPNYVHGMFVRNATNGDSKKYCRVSPLLTLPICEMVVDVVTNEINWRWLLEPIVDKMSGNLRINQSSALVSLTDEAVDEIVDTVNRWYAADR